MSLIGSINILAGLDATEVASGSKTAVGQLAKVETAADKVGKSLDSAPASLSGGLGAIGAGFGALAGLAATAAGAYGLTSFVKSSMDAMNVTRGLAERLGVTSDSLSRLQYAAKLADVDSSVLAGSLEKLNIRLAEVAQEGKGPAADALKKFGLSANDLAKKGPVEAFHEIVKVLEGIPNPASRAAAAVDFFGKSGTAMLNLVAQGSDGIAALEAEAEGLGVAFSDIDAAKLDEADDALTRVWEGVAGIGNTLAIETAPWLTLVSEQIVEWGKQGAQSGSYVSQAFGWVSEAVGLVVDVVDMLGLAFVGARSVMTSGIAYIISGLAKMVEALDWVLQKVAGVSSGMGEFMTVWADEAHKGADEQWKSFADRLAGPSLRESARKLIDDVQLDATVRAVKSVDEAKKNKVGGAAGDLEKTDKGTKEEKLSGAFEFGSKEAIKVVAQSRGLAGGNESKEIAANTATTAENSGRQLTALTKISDALTAPGNVVTNMGAV